MLQEFFHRGEDGWHNQRADIEIAKAQEKSDKARTSAGKRWHNDGNANAMRTQSEGNAPNNQKPRTKVKAERGTRLPADWQPDDELRAWAAGARPDLDIAVTVEKFRDYWHAIAGSRGVKLDWGKTFRNWVREEKPGRAPAASQPQAPMLVGTCACGAPATVKVGGKPRCQAHVRGLEVAA